MPKSLLQGRPFGGLITSHFGAAFRKSGIFEDRGPGERKYQYVKMPLTGTLPSGLIGCFGVPKITALIVDIMEDRNGLGAPPQHGASVRAVSEALSDQMQYRRVSQDIIPSVHSLMSHSPRQNLERSKPSARLGPDSSDATTTWQSPSVASDRDRRSRAESGRSMLDVSLTHAQKEKMMTMADVPAGSTIDEAMQRDDTHAWKPLDSFLVVPTHTNTKAHDVDFDDCDTNLKYRSGFSPLLYVAFL